MIFATQKTATYFGQKKYCYMDKIKMLVIPSDLQGGIGKYRTLDPHKYIAEHYGDEFDIDIVKSMPHEDLETYLKQYDLVQFHKQIDRDGKIVEMLNFLGIPCIMDIDDYFFLGNDHPMSLSAKKEMWHLPIIDHLKKANYVTTTTSIYANVLKKYNPNVKVLPNAVDGSEKQFSIPKEKGDGRLRVGIICGSTHLKDLELMKGVTQLVDLNKVQFVLCGFDTRGTKRIYNKDTNTTEVRDIKPEESVWVDFEKIFTNNYKTISEEHKKFLMEFNAYVDDPFTNEPYRRMWTRDITNYASHYANVDVLVAPLKENDFNKMKSELKEIECGFTHTAFIGQNFGAYTINLVPMIEKGGKINENGNALLVDTAKNHKQWAKYINKLADDREMLKKLQDNLADFVKANYSLEKICKERADFYKKVVQESKGN